MWGTREIQALLPTSASRNKQQTREKAQEEGDWVASAWSDLLFDTCIVSPDLRSVESRQVVGHHNLRW